MPVHVPRPYDERQAGFTLIELLVVIIIIGILAAIAIPVFLHQREKGYDSQARADLRNVATAEETYLSDFPVGYAPCDSTAGPSGCRNVLSAQVWKPSTNASTAVAVDVAVGYCAVSKTTNSDYFVYDSEAGGLQTTKASSFGSISWPTGACAVASNRPAAF
jgi:type IV pilus assembly protein PilA